MNFEEYLEARGYSDNTKSQYGYYAKMMPETLVQEDVDRLVMEHKNSVFRAFLRSYIFGFLKRKDLDVIKIRGRKGKKILRFLEPEEIFKLVQASDDAWLKAVIMLGFHSGLRISETLGIRPTDVDLVKMRVRILGKGNKEDWVPLSNATAVLLKPLLETVPKDARIFKTTRQNVNQRLDKISNIVLGKRVTPHMLRHSCGRWLKKNGMPLEDIKEFLRHVNLETTVIYAEATDTEVADNWRRIMDA